jgi:ABC-type antimicrobial peptide transport system permease subunit
VLDYTVLSRRREIGIRIAIGAPAARVAAGVVSDVFATVACGAALGSGAGLSASRYMEALLYGVTPAEPGVLIGAALAMLATAGAAAVAPAVRAVRIDPMAVLRIV